MSSIKAGLVWLGSMLLVLIAGVTGSVRFKQPPAAAIVLLLVIATLPSPSGARADGTATGTWLYTGSMIMPRVDHSATLLPNGKVLVAGGNMGGTTSAELYDPTTGTWAATGNMTTPRQAHTATLLPDGMVLVAGGQNNSTPYLASAELYNPATATWTATGSMVTGRYLHTATLLNNGQALVAGGCCANSEYLASAELYDPVSGTWTSTGTMTDGRWYHTATLLSDGQVLVAGGGDNTSLETASAELYDPDSGVWTSTGSMNIPRTFHTATLLPDGQVLVAGGCCTFVSNGSGETAYAVASAELYGTPLASLAISPTAGRVGSTIAMTGTAFSPEEPIDVYWDNSDSAPVTTTLAGADGSFVTQFSIPQAISGTHTIIAIGHTSSMSATATFQIKPFLLAQPYTGHAGSTAIVAGLGLGAQEPVTLYWDKPLTKLGGTITSTQGSFYGATAVTYTVPLGASAGPHLIYGVGPSNHVISAATFIVN